MEKEERKRALEESIHSQEALLNQTRRDAEHRLATLDSKLRIAEQLRQKLEEVCSYQMVVNYQEIDHQKSELMAERIASQNRLRESEISVREEEVNRSKTLW